MKNVDATNICSGYKIDNSLKTKNPYIDLTGSLRHQMCSYILEADGKCEFCTCAMKSVKQQTF